MILGEFFMFLIYIIFVDSFYYFLYVFFYLLLMNCFNLDWFRYRFLLIRELFLFILKFILLLYISGILFK